MYKKIKKLSELLQKELIYLLEQEIKKIKNLMSQHL
jgi:hypothetical protein